MTVEVVCPKWGLTMEEAEISSWQKAIGDRVSLDEVIGELESDKITGELYSPTTGVLIEIRAEVGRTVVPGEVIAIIEEDQ